MAVAVVSHSALSLYATQVGFPLYTKVKCDSGLNGYQLWDKWIRENVQWVSQLGYDPVEHVKITESAQLVGELKKPWELRCQKFVEGDEQSNTFKAMSLDLGESDTTFHTHVNRQAIQVAVSNAYYKYKIDFETDEDGSVVTHNSLSVAIFDKAEDSSISYSSEIEVAQLWTTKVEHTNPVTDGETSTPLLFMRAYAKDSVIEDAYPWLLVGELTPAEYEEWQMHNLVPEVKIEDGPSIDPRAIDEGFACTSEPVDVATFLGNILSEPVSYPADVKLMETSSGYGIAAVGSLDDELRREDWLRKALDQAGYPDDHDYVNNWVKDSEAPMRTVTVAYPTSDDSGVSGDVNA